MHAIAYMKNKLQQIHAEKRGESRPIYFKTARCHYSLNIPIKGSVDWIMRSLKLIR